MTHSLEYSKIDTKELRKFGLVMAAALTLIFGLFLPWLFSFDFPRWPWVAAGVFAGLGLLLPIALKPVYWLWMKFAMALGWFNTRLILGIVFYLVILPAGLLMRMLGKDPMARKLDQSMDTYRVASTPTPSSRLEKPF